MVTLVEVWHFVTMIDVCIVYVNAGCALGDLAGPMVVSICLQKTLQADS